jgi:predicted Zn-dependent protease
MARLLARRAERLGEALQEAETALKGRKSPEFLDTKARVIIEGQSPGEAIALAEEAVKRDPRNLAWQATLAVALYRAGQTAAALGKYRQLRQQDRQETWLDTKILEQVYGYGPKFSATLDQIFPQL